MFLCGNHEHFLISLLELPNHGDQTEMRDTVEMWLAHGGEEAIRNFDVPLHEGCLRDLRQLRDSVDRSLGPNVRSFLKQLRLTHREGDYLFVHAGVHPMTPLRAQDDSQFLWIRQPFLDSLNGWYHDFCVIHGHTPSCPEVLAHRIGVDTGVYLSQALSAVQLRGDELRFLTAAPTPTSDWQDHFHMGAPAIYITVGECSPIVPLHPAGQASPEPDYLDIDSLEHESLDLDALELDSLDIDSPQADPLDLDLDLDLDFDLDILKLDSFEIATRKPDARKPGTFDRETPQHDSLTPDTFQRVSLEIDSRMPDPPKLDSTDLDGAKNEATEIATAKPDLQILDSGELGTHRSNSLKIDAVPLEPLDFNTLKFDALDLDVLKLESLKTDPRKPAPHKLDLLDLDALKIDSLDFDTFDFDSLDSFPEKSKP
ncbi:MAG: hypothetical protein FIA97_00105 [Methylococcaceae bacterium]|nr:hypothetical protein [Methylococcaceae bacterium]